LLGIIGDNPFFSYLIKQAKEEWLPKIADHAMSYVSPYIKKYMPNSKLADGLSKAYNLDPQDEDADAYALNRLGDGALSERLLVPPISDGATSGIHARLGRCITSDDVNIPALCSVIWPENEGARIHNPEGDSYTAVLQGSLLLSNIPTNALGNLYIAISPINIAASSFFITYYNTATATAATLGTATYLPGALYPQVNNFTFIRVNSMSVQIKTLIAPINRSGTISIAMTDRYRYLTAPPDFNNIMMAPVALNSSLALDDFNILYIPDEVVEWSFIDPTSNTNPSSDLLISINGSYPSAAVIQILLSYTLEYDPSPVIRPMVTLARPEIAPSTIPAIHIIAKHYSSLLVESPNNRGQLCATLQERFGTTATMTELSRFLSQSYGPLASMINSSGSAPSTHTSGIAPIVSAIESALLPTIPEVNKIRSQPPSSNVSIREQKRKDASKKKLDLSDESIILSDNLRMSSQTSINSLTIFLEQNDIQHVRTDKSLSIVLLSSDISLDWIVLTDEGPFLDLSNATPNNISMIILSWLRLFNNFITVKNYLESLVDQDNWVINITFNRPEFLTATSTSL
jgi:hypothetical protein